ncbi:MAG: diaminopimelate epimerase [Armatimonadetes bacterium]|nr:diaminopimelate epimerase [Armatimonadota bacterium]
MIEIPFAKVEAIGNHFVLINALNKLELDWSMLAVQMCQAHFGVGADGLLVLVPSAKANFGFRMFNPDGTEDMCGNGLRCSAVYVYSNGICGKNKLTFETMSGISTAEIIKCEDNSGDVKVNMGKPSLRAADIPMNADIDEVIDFPLEVGGKVYLVTCVSIGTPHAVIQAPLDFFWKELPAVSRVIESHPIFPKKVNVTWWSVSKAGELRIRTWERGVGATLGCGTGACSALVAANVHGAVGKSANVISPGGTLYVEWLDQRDIYITGPARVVFEGVWVTN